MKLAKYLSSLLPSFTRDRVSEDIRLLREELSQSTMPPLQAAADRFGRNGLKSSSVKEFDALFIRQTRDSGVRASNWMAMCVVSLERAGEVMEYLSARVDKDFSKDVSAEGMTYLRANILRYVEVVSFALRYSRKALLWSLAEEMNAETTRKDSPLTKAEMSWLLANRDVFFRAMVILATPKREAERFFKNIPNMVVIPSEVDTVEQTVGVSRLDPFQFGIIPVRLNLIYHVRMAVTDWQVGRYRASQEELKALEYRLLALQEQRESGQIDAKLEQQIEYTEGRLQKLNFKLEQMTDVD